MPVLRLLMFALAAFVGGTLVASAAVDAPADGVCSGARTLDQPFVEGYQLWPFGSDCGSFAMAPSVPLTLASIVVTGGVLVVGRRYRDHAVARALVATAATLAATGLIVQGAGYPPAIFGFAFAPFAALAAEVRLRRDIPSFADMPLLDMLAPLVLGGLVWVVATFFFFWGWPLVGVLLAPPVAVAFALVVSRFGPSPSPNLNGAPR